MLHLLPNSRRMKPRRVPRAAVWAVVLLALPTLPGCQEAPDAPLLPGNPTQEELDYQAGRVPGQSFGGPAPSNSDLPVLVALGAGQCIPCRQMQPDLDALREQYAGAMELVYIDVYQDRTAGHRYGIRTIPTQIFYDASGRELFRHEGYSSMEDILATWTKLGVSLQPDDAGSTPEAG